MNLFQALEWLSKNKKKVLVVKYSKGDNPYTVRLNGAELEISMCYGWDRWTPDYENPERYTFTIPDRKLPELPRGCEWVRDSQGELYIPHLFVYYYSVCSDDIYKIYKALIEEYETRPK